MGIGGAAATKGFLFQQRVCAAFLLIEILEKPISFVLGEKFEFRPKSFVFEGNDEIDDLHIVTDGGSIFANIKTNLRFSTSKDAALRSAFEQFAKQHKKASGDERYLLICDDKSSSQIQALRELLERISLITFSNLQAAILDEQDRKIFSQAASLAKTLLDVDSEEEAFKFLQKISIVVFSFDFSASFIQALKVLAASEGFNDADRLWEKLTLDCFVFAKARQVLDAQYIKARYEKFKADDVGVSESRFFYELDIEKENVDWVKEIVVVEWDNELDRFLPSEELDVTSEARIAIMEMFRFDEAGDRRLEFEDGKVKLLNGSRMTVLGRMAGFSALHRMIDLQKIDFGKATVQLMPADIDWVAKKNESSAEKQANLAKLSFEERSPKDTCLECGRPLFATRVQLVEIDEIGRRYQCGPVHLDCLTPTSRVIGDVQMPAADQFKVLGSFDINKWAQLIKRGPSGYELLDSVSKEVFILWNWTNAVKAKGDHCIKMIGKDAAGQLEEQYVTERGKIVLRGKDDQSANAKKFENAIASARQSGDPICFEVAGMYGPKSQFHNVDREFGDIFEVQEFVVERYSREKMASSSANFQWYAPICVMRTTSGKLFEYRNAILLVRDPFRADRLIKQFKLLETDVATTGVWLDIVESDHEFDSLVGSCIHLGLDVIIDPALDSNGNFRRGARLEPIAISDDDRRSLFEFSTKDEVV